MSREQTWDKNIQLLLVAIIAFNILPHMADIPIWASALSYFFLAWKALALTRGLARPPRWFLWSISVACSIGVFFEYKTILGHEAASALLVTLASAKLLETNRYRDAMFVIFTAFFLLMAHLLNSQSLGSTIFMALDVLLITTLMFQLHKQERRKSPRAFRPVMKMLALAIPVWVFLFVAFPRFSTGMYRLTVPNAAGGFSENLDPGEIESLTDSQEVAFRVNFNSKLPPMEELYWRGAILTVSNGLKWTKPLKPSWGPDSFVPDQNVKEFSDYQLFLEPRFRTWLFALDYPKNLSIPQRLQGYGMRERTGQIYETARPLTSRISYSASAATEAPVQRLLAPDREALLELPENLDPRIVQTAKQWVDEAKQMGENPLLPTLADKIGDRGFKWFIDQKFRYTKQPGSLTPANGANQLAQFLFERKRGFCEHYAAAFATLMRAAGIPARVTVGFQGGIRNDYGGYWVVRDLDAHAWTEIWRQDPVNKNLGRWVRVDPTSVIAPLRMRLGGDYNLLGADELQANLNSGELQAQLNARTNRWIWKAEAAWDAVQMRYNAFLNDYDFEFQKSLLEKIGIPEVTRLLLFSLVGIGIGAFIFAFSLALRRKAHRVDPLLKVWRDFCKKLERAGVERASNEGPLDFAERASEKYPQAASQIFDVAKLFAELRYGPPNMDSSDGPTKEKLKALRQSVRRLSIKASS